MTDAAETAAPDRAKASAVDTDAGPPGDPAELAWPAAAAALFLLFAWPTAAGLARVYQTDGNFSHGFLVPIIAAYLAWQLRDKVLATPDDPHAIVGAVPLAVGVALVLLARWYEVSLLPRGVNALFLAGVGLVLALAGLCWLLLGRAATVRLGFPLGFLLLGMPIPSFLLNKITLPLQRIAAIIAAACMRLVGMTVTRAGNVLELPNGSLGVAEACSGIRSLVVLAAVALLMAFMNRLRAALAVLLLAAVLPIAVAGNAIRVIVSGILYACGLKDLAHGGPHELLGLFTFALAVAMLLGVCSLLLRLQRAAEASRRQETEDDDATSSRDTDEPSAVPTEPGPALLERVNRHRTTLILAGAILFGGAALSFGLEHHYDRVFARQTEPLAARVPLAELPARIGSYRRIATDDLSDEEYEMLAPSDRLLATYLGPGNRQFHVTLLYWEPPSGRPSERPDLLRRPHTPDECYPAAGWKRLWDYDEDREFPWLPGELGSIRVYRREGQVQVLAFWLGLAFKRTLAPDQLFSRLKSMVRSWNYAPAANLHTVSITTNTTGDVDEAREAALRFAEALAEHLPDHGIGHPPGTSAGNASTTPSQPCPLEARSASTGK